MDLRDKPPPTPRPSELDGIALSPADAFRSGGRPTSTNRACGTRGEERQPNTTYRERLRTTHPVNHCPRAGCRSKEQQTGADQKDVVRYDSRAADVATNLRGESLRSTSHQLRDTWRALRQLSHEDRSPEICPRISRRFVFNLWTRQDQRDATSCSPGLETCFWTRTSRTFSIAISKCR